MEEFTRILTNKRRLNARVKELSSSDIEDVITKLTAIKHERLDEEKEAEKERQRKEEKIEELKAKAEELDISLEDLIPNYSERTEQGSNKPKKPPKYAIALESGKQKTWTGQGRMPNAFIEALENGHELEEYLIK